MAEPVLEEEPESDPPEEADEPEPAEEPEEPETVEDIPDEPTVEEVDLSEDDLSDGSSGDDLFTGTEEAESAVESDSSDSEGDGSDEDESDGDALDALGSRGESMEEAINEGAARAAVVGLTEEDGKEELRDEFEETFKAFRLGYFGSRFVEEYVFVDEDDEVDPAWGMFGSLLISAALVVWMRPDGDEMVEKAQDAVGNLAGGDLL